MGRTVYYDYSGNEVEPPKADTVKHTRADRIRSMSEEELAKHLCCPWKECKNINLECDKCLLDWLREEISE